MKKTILIFMFVFFVNFSFALTENLTVQEKAEICLNESHAIYVQMSNDNFNVLRINDTLKTATTLYEGQILAKEKGKLPDFSLVIPYCDEIKNTQKTAYLARDEFLALKKFYSETFKDNAANTSSVEILILEIESELNSERYEKVSPLIDKTYNEIINIQSRQSSFNAFYENTRTGLKNFLEDNGFYLALFLVFCLLMFFVYKKAIYKMIINKKINNLELRKKTLKEILQKTQKDYFQNGKISENEFNIKTKKLAELIRDIDRQIPLLYEDIAKLNKPKKSKKRK